MKANWSLVLNIVLLFGVVFAITRLILLRKKEIQSSDNVDEISYVEAADDIIAVRKIESNDDMGDVGFKLCPAGKDEVSAREPHKTQINQKELSEKSTFNIDVSKMVMIFLSAKEHQEFVGYELLQSLLAAGLRFGEGNIFHKYQKANGQGAVLFSLAAATQTGTFDLQTMGSYSVRGLCVYMYLSGNKNIDSERFSLMYDTAKSLAEDLDADLLDDKKKTFSAASMDSYRSYIDIDEVESL